MSSVVELSSKKDFTNSGQLKNYKDKTVLIKFYTNWCGHCRRSIPDYEELSKQYKNDKSVVIAQIDGDKSEDIINILNKLRNGPKIHGYPTILLFKNNLYVDIFNDDRTINAYKKFIKTHYKKK